MVRERHWLVMARSEVRAAGVVGKVRLLLFSWLRHGGEIDGQERVACLAVAWRWVFESQTERTGELGAASPIAMGCSR